MNTLGNECGSNVSSRFLGERCVTSQTAAKETLLLDNSHPGQSFSLFLCGPISISRANAHMVHMG